MRHTRRRWIHGLLAVATYIFWRREAYAQGDETAYCSGVISDPHQRGIADLIVQLVEPTGRVHSDKTKGKGEFRLPAPIKGTYILVFRESQGKTQLHDVRQLTAGANQQLCVTIDPSRSSFQGAYAALQGVETLAAWLFESDIDRKLLAKDIQFRDVLATLEAVDPKKVDVPPHQREFLDAKRDCVRRLVNLTGMSQA